MTDIEKALVEYDGDRSKPFCDLVYAGLKLLQKQEQGRVVHIPCAPGTTVFRHDTLGRIIAANVIAVSIMQDAMGNQQIYISTSAHMYSAHAIGTALFLTRAQAEAAKEGRREQES